MSIISPIKYVVYDGQRVPTGANLPVVSVAADTEAYGTITLDLPITSDASTTASVYSVLPPTTGDPRWIRDSTDMRPDSTSMLWFQGAFTSVPQYQINWRFDPKVIDATSGQYYSAEFFVNQSDDASVKQSSPKLILKIKDQIGS